VRSHFHQASFALAAAVGTLSGTTAREPVGVPCETIPGSTGRNVGTHIASFVMIDGAFDLGPILVLESLICDLAYLVS